MEIASGVDEEASGRLFYYLYNENFTETFMDEDRDELIKELLQGKGLDDKLRVKIALVLSFYLKHFHGLTKGIKVSLLTTDSMSKRIYETIFKSEALKKHLGPI